MNESAQTHLVDANKTAMLIAIAMRVLGPRALTLTALTLNTIVFSFVLYAGGWDRLAAATIFAIANWCLVTLQFFKRKDDHET